MGFAKSVLVYLLRLVILHVTKGFYVKEDETLVSSLFSGPFP